MSRLIESICIKNGSIRNLELHQKRINTSREKLFGFTDKLDVESLISHKKNSLKENELIYKCRVIYSQKIDCIEFIRYQMRVIKKIKLIENNEIDYSFKFENRIIFKELKRENDEILIVKNNQITDTSFSNIVFFDGEKWVTPVTCLLNGTMRQSLLQSGKVKEIEIKDGDLKYFKSFKLINAMMNLEESPELDLSVISW